MPSFRTRASHTGHFRSESSEHCQLHKTAHREKRPITVASRRITEWLYDIPPHIRALSPFVAETMPPFLYVRQQYNSLRFGSPQPQPPQTETITYLQRNIRKSNSKKKKKKRKYWMYVRFCGTNQLKFVPLHFICDFYAPRLVFAREHTAHSVHTHTHTNTIIGNRFRI